jgi:membrane associated rhomboid family serine protease
VFPLRDTNPSPLFPVVNLLLIAANVIVAYFAFRGVIGDPEAARVLIEAWALVPERDFIPVSKAPSLFEWVRPYFTSMFMHGGLLHIAANMWSLWIFGDNVEGAFGSLKYLVFYLLCGVGAALTHVMLNPDSAMPVVGASGAIAGVMGAYLFLFPHARIHMFTLLIFYPIFFDLPAFVFLILWFIGQLVAGTGSLMASASGEEVGGIAFAAHIGGFITGIVLLPLFKRRRRSR